MSPPVVTGDLRTEVRAFEPFVFQGVAVQGSTLPAAALRAAATPFVGRTLGLGDLKPVMEALAAVYARSDVALYSILLPRQDFTGGVVRVRVVEGHVAGVRVKPQRGRPAPRLTLAYAQALQGQKPLTKPRLERQLNLMRDIPGANPRIQLLQSSEPGGVILDIEPKVRRLEASLSGNSRGAAMLGKTQVELGVRLNSLLREGDRTELTLVAPTDVERFQFVSLAERQPIGERGAAVTFSAGYLRTRPKIAGYDIRGEALSAGLTVIHPLIRSNSRNLYLTAGLDGLNSDNALFGRTISREHTRALRVAAAYSHSAPKSAEQLSITLSRGLDVAGARVADPRFSDKTFSKLNAALSKVVFNDRTALRLAAAGQYSRDLVPASEKFAVGGAQFGRAFPSAAIVGDSGYAVSVEAALRHIAKGSRFAGSELYGFADYGQVVQGRRSTLARDDEVASAGAGVRVVVSRKGMIEIEAAKALNDVGWRGDVRPVRIMANFRTLL